ncbi:hypothetical protein Hypma_016302 [Hypsizygus marmoreus]|uniref:Uncharacterized protein n=1 Tax=Hypsizygus marmoreus TaxID=39966 RepID=A0A369J4M0_HYPMA|nr:hypothetical protein Hypma_016302 [Hypsizygus marmoreus]
MSPPPGLMLTSLSLHGLIRLAYGMEMTGDRRGNQKKKQELGFYEIFASRPPNLQYISIAMRCPARLAGVLEDVPTITASLTTSRIQHTGPIFRAGTIDTRMSSSAIRLAHPSQPRWTAGRQNALSLCYAVHYKTSKQSERTHPGRGLGHLVRNILLASLRREDIVPLVDIFYWCLDVKAL